MLKGFPVCASPPELNKHRCAHHQPTEPAGYTDPNGWDALAPRAARQTARGLPTPDFERAAQKSNPSRDSEPAPPAHLHTRQCRRRTHHCGAQLQKGALPGTNKKQTFFRPPPSGRHSVNVRKRTRPANPATLYQAMSAQGCSVNARGLPSGRCTPKLHKHRCAHPQPSKPAGYADPNGWDAGLKSCQPDCEDMENMLFVAFEHTLETRCVPERNQGLELEPKVRRVKSTCPGPGPRGVKGCRST